MPNTQRNRNEMRSTLQSAPRLHSMRNSMLFQYCVVFVKLKAEAREKKIDVEIFIRWNYAPNSNVDRFPFGCCCFVARSLHSITVANQLPDNISLFLTTINTPSVVGAITFRFWVSLSLSLAMCSIRPETFGRVAFGFGRKWLVVVGVVCVVKSGLSL